MPPASVQHPSDATAAAQVKTLQSPAFACLSATLGTVQAKIELGNGYVVSVLTLLSLIHKRYPLRQ